MKTDIAVCYHKPSMLFKSDALKPMHLGKARTDLNLGIRGDDTGHNISTKNPQYAEDTAAFWLWKNSNADVKGIMHYRRLLDLRKPGGPERHIVQEDITSAQEFLSEFKLDAAHISKILKRYDIITRVKQDIRRYPIENMEQQYKACDCCMPELLDWMMEIIKSDFPEIYPTAKKYLAKHKGYFCNLVVMKSELFDSMCGFRFAVMEKLEKLADKHKSKVAVYAKRDSRQVGFIGERLTGIYIEYLQSMGKKVIEYPGIMISPREAHPVAQKNATAASRIKRILVKFLCGFIPSGKIRRKIRGIFIG